MSTAKRPFPFKRAFPALWLAIAALALAASPARPATDVIARGLAVGALNKATQALNSGAGVVTVRTVTADDPATPGVVALLPSDQVLIISQSSPHPVTVTFTCSPGYNKVVKDGLGFDANNGITLAPQGLNTLGGASTIEGFATFLENTSTSGTPPYDSRAIICDEFNNAHIY